MVVNKKRKEIERSIKNIEDNYKYIETDKNNYERIISKENEINFLETQFDSLKSYFKLEVESVLKLLNEEKFIEGKNNDENTLKLTLQGKIASQIREIHCLVFSKLYNEMVLDKLSSKQLVALFSCFTNIRVQEEFKDNLPKSNDCNVNKIILKVLDLCDYYRIQEISRNINTGYDYEIHYDLLNYVEKWCDAENIEDCKLVLQEMHTSKEIFLGEFVKALLKINNISNELEKIAEMTGNIAFLSKLKEIPNITLKYVVTNQSLYV